MRIFRLLVAIVVFGGTMAGGALIVIGVMAWWPSVLVLVWFALWVRKHVRSDRKASQERIAQALSLHDHMGPEGLPEGFPKKVRMKRGTVTFFGDVDTYRPNPDLPSALDN